MKEKAFELTSKVQDPKLFIGRTEYLENLVEKLLCGSNLQIVGMPKIGKSSLVYQLKLRVEQEWNRSKEISLRWIWFDVSQINSPKDFFNQLVRSIDQELPEQNRKSDSFELASKGKLDLFNISQYFKFIKENVSCYFLICLDKFDSVRHYLKRQHFGCLRAIVDDTDKLSLIITSRRILVNIEKEVCDSANPSTLHQLFHTINLKPFNDIELDLYWEHLASFEMSKGLLTDTYKQGAVRYAGRFPYFLNLYNSHFFQRNNDNDDFFEMMDRKFHDIVNVLKEQDLLNPSLQIVFGPFYNCTNEQIKELKRYGFILPVSLDEKEKITGITNGYIDEEGYAYVCFSEYFTKRLKNEYQTQMPFWPEWERALQNLRFLVSDYICQNTSDDWEAEKRGPFQNAMESNRDNDKDVGIPVSDSLLDYLIDKDLLKIITCAWEVFRHVFNMDLTVFKEKTDTILYIRNHHAHVNSSGLSRQKAYLEEKTKLCVELSELIKKWYESGSRDLTDKNIIAPSFVGTVQSDNGCYHVGPFALSTAYVKKNDLDGASVSITKSCFNKSNGNNYLYYALNPKKR